MPAKSLHIKQTLKTCHDIGSAKDAMWEAESNLARRMTIPQGIRKDVQLHTWEEGKKWSSSSDKFFFQKIDFK